MSKKRYWKSLTAGGRFALLTALACVLFGVATSSAAPMNGLESQYTQPDGTIITLRFFGDEFYARAESSDGYTIVFDPGKKAYCFAALSPDGNEFVSTGQEVGKADPAKLGIKKSLKINPESRAAKAKKRYMELEAVVHQEARWTAVKDASRKYHEFKKRVKAQEKAGKKGFVIPLGTIFPDSEIPAAPLITSAAEGDGTVSEEPPIELAPPSFQLLGDIVGLTILVDFSDDVGTIAQKDVDDYCNKPGFSTWSNKGSIYDYFYTQSASRLRYNNNVTYYVRVPQPKTYYNVVPADPNDLNSGTCGRLLLNDALNVLLANGYDFSQLTTKSGGYVRACNVLFAGANSGHWAQGLWPHRSAISAKSVGGGKYISDYQITNMGTSLTIGTFCHENGHMLLGYTDYYDYATDGIDSAGMGSYTLMAYSGSGTCPHNIHGYLKWHSGWLDAIELYGAPTPQRCAVRVDSDTIYKYTNPSLSTEYFMIENRAKYGWEANGSLPDTGLFITHNDQNGKRDAQNMTQADHFECSVEQADGLFHLETNTNYGDASDLFHSGGTGPKTSFDDTTLPNAKWWLGADGTAASGTASGLSITNISAVGPTMTFIYGTGTPSGSPVIGLDANTSYVRCNYGVNATSDSFGIFNKGGGTLDYTISDNQSWLSCSANGGTATTESDLITVNFSTSTLTAGTHTATITVSDPAASPTTATLTVNLTVNAQPILAVSRTTISENGLSGMTGPQVSIAINNTGGGAMTYSLSKTQSWLTLSSTNGSVVGETDTIYVTLDSTLLASGTYNDTITITSPEASNSPRTIPVSFSVNGDEIIVTSPNGGETLVAGTPLHIAWGSNIGGTVSIVLLKNGFLDTLIASSTANDGSYSWTIPNTKTGSDFKIRITSLDASPGFADESNGTFSLQRPPLLNEKFEASQSLPAGWTQALLTGNVTWKVQNGGGTSGGSNPSTAHSGTNNMALCDSDAADDISRLYTPKWDAIGYTNLVLNFWHTQAYWSPDQDYLNVFYSTNGGSSWAVIASYSNDVVSWTERSLTLPATGTNCMVAFEGNAKYGFGVCIDDVSVTGGYGGSPVIVTKSGGSIDVVEGGATDTYTVVLGAAPTQNVVITVTPDSQVSVNTSTLTFTTGNWATPQTVTVTAVNDIAHEMNHFGTITHSAASTDPTYNGAAVDSLLVSITDNDNSAPTVDAGPDQTVLLTGGVWSPAFISPLAWYDANDAATLTQSGGVVSQWNDKSGRSNHLVQATAAYRPVTTNGQINGLTAIAFDGGNDELRTPVNPFGTTISNACVMAVFNIGALGQSTVFSLSGSSATANRWQSHSPWDVGGVVYFDTGGTAAPNRLNYTSGWAASRVVLMGYYCSVSDSVQEIWEGGTKKISDASGHAVTTAGGFTFGSATSTQYDNVKIGESVIINGTITATDRQSLEGYLAHKWGLTGTLPANHPYKAEAPSTASATTNLNGTVTDADNDPVTTLWSLVSGPGPVVFADATAVDTIANFKVQGVYTLRLSASDGVLQTTDDVVITVTTNALPGAIMAPTGLSAGAVATNRIDLAWTDNSANETGFVIERSATGGSGFAVIGTAAANATIYTDSTVSAASTYYYRVSATNTTASSTPSAEASATTPKIPAAIILSNLSQTYNGTARVVTYTTAPTGLAVTMTYNGRASAPTNTGSYAVTGTVISATYAGSTNGTLTVSPKSASTFTIANVGPFTYDGAAKTPEPQVNDGATVLVKNSAYTLAYAANTNAGVATVTVIGINNYTGTQAKNFTISPATLTVTPTSGQSKTFGAANPTLTYNNTGAAAGETAGFSGALSRVVGESIGTYAITQGTLALAANGAFKVANYTLSFTPGVTFAVTAKSVSTLTIANVGPFTYDGSAKTPEPEVRDGLTVLAKGVDYTLSYANNTDAGTATLTVTGMGNYTGSQNRSFTINKASPTVNPWPTGTVITVGQPLSASTLSGGSASVSGTFSFDAPSTVPPVGVCTTAVTFAADDSVNYTAVNGTGELTVREALPPAPTSLTALPSVGQVALSWTPSAGATGYNVKRATTLGGTYSTIASPAGTNFVDSGLSSGTTYYYRVSSLNAGGESDDSGAGSALIPYGLPFVENFEGLIVGSLDGQNGWSAVDTIVQTATARGTQAASITSAAGSLQHAFEGANTNVWTDFMLQPVFFENTPTLPDPMGTVNFYFSNSGHPVVFDGTTPRELTTITVTTGAWVRVTVRSDYAARKWDLYVNASQAATNLAFYASTPLVYTGLKVSGAGTSSVALDDLSISLLPPWSQANKGTVLLFMLQ